MSRTHRGRITAGLIALVCIGIDARAVHAECDIHTQFGGGSGATATATRSIGQSFIACQDGVLSNLAIYVGQSTQNLVQFRLHVGTDLSTSAYSAMGTLIPFAPRIRFTPGFAVTAGQVYSYSLTPNSGVLTMSVRGLESPDYPGGTQLVLENGVTTPLDTDLMFSLTISDPPVPATVATWGTIKSTYR